LDWQYWILELTYFPKCAAIYVNVKFGCVDIEIVAFVDWNDLFQFIVLAISGSKCIIGCKIVFDQIVHLDPQIAQKK